ncbi:MULTISPECIES: hypothetical protein [unclassified Sphingomonas]|uniref:hypothetical protein n=1 Tax=unclassified Sphingomonas TaxID=196159 RepID=UPI000A763028|nr:MULTISPECIES: hypothetical protein [unclassified Sphingomonas]
MHHPSRPTVWHGQSCRCSGCNPPAPSIVEPSPLRTVIEMVAALSFGLFNAWVVDRLLDGPGIQIMFGY